MKNEFFLFRLLAMRRLMTVLAVLTILQFAGVGSAAAQAKENAKDREAIQNMAQTWQEAWNQHDMESLAALVAENVDFINVAGIWVKTRKDFKDFHAQRHALQFKESVWATKNAEVKFVKPDVAIAHVEWSIKGDKNPDGTPRQPRQGIFTWVIEKRKGIWLIIAAQNTDIREPQPSK